MRATDELQALFNQTARLPKYPRPGGGPPALGGPSWYPSLPWNEFPDGGQYFDYPGVIATPALGTVDAVVLTFPVPAGWNGIIAGISNNYTGGGFVAGSGDLIWRIRVGGRFVKNYDNILVQLGTTDRVRDTKIQVRSAEVVEYLVSVDPAAGIPIAGTQIICAMSGWFFPIG